MVHTVDGNGGKRPIKAKRLKRQRDRIVEVMGRFDDGVLDTVEYRASIPSGFDGYGDGKSGAGSGGDVSDPTGNAALRLVEGKSDFDPQQVACERIDSAFQNAWKALEEAEKAWDAILHASEAIRGRQTTLGTCQACLRDDVPNVGDDRIKAGYCPACYKAWCRTDQGHGRQDRHGFELSRRELHVVESDGGFYGVGDLDGLVANGTLPNQPKHAKAEPSDPAV